MLIWKLNVLDHSGSSQNRVPSPFLSLAAILSHIISVSFCAADSLRVAPCSEWKVLGLPDFFLAIISTR